MLALLLATRCISIMLFIVSRLFVMWVRGVCLCFGTSPCVYRMLPVGTIRLLLLLGMFLTLTWVLALLTLSMMVVR